MRRYFHSGGVRPSFALSIIPLVWLIGCVILVAILYGASSVLDAGKYIMLSSAILAMAMSHFLCHRPWRLLMLGVRKSWSQISPALFILVLIALVSTSWMLSGVVPTLMCYGMDLLNPRFFLVATGIICAVVSVFTGSSWTTIATIGVALQGIGEVFGFSHGWIAGAIISGAYFGDKVSPLSDTTVLASSTCGVPLLTHVRYLMITTIPSLTIGLVIYLIAGLCFSGTDSALHTNVISDSLGSLFFISPWLLLIPVITLLLIIKKVGANITLAISSLLGVIAMLICQPQILQQIQCSGGVIDCVWAVVKVLSVGTVLETDNAFITELTATGGIKGMFSTIALVLCATLFGGAMLGSGMLASITKAIVKKLRTVRKIVSATVGTGFLLNTCSGDQFLSIILASSIFKNVYRRNGLEDRLLSRSIEDSVSVTSVLIPWNSCGMTQATVLGVPTLVYLPYCFFNYLSPLMSLLVAYTGYKIFKRK